MAPVFSNLPAPSADARPSDGEHLLGLFGYSYQGAAVSVALDAIALLRDRGVEVRLRLLGAPGAASEAGELWTREARARSLEQTLSFSGMLPAQELSDELAHCELLLFADTPGPSARKGTLAGSLASGRPVVAIDGPRRWSELLDARALELTAPTSAALADAVEALLADREQREALGARGRAFAEDRMGLARTATVTAGLLDRALAGSRSAGS